VLKENEIRTTKKQQAENIMVAKKLKESSMETKPSKMMIQTHYECYFLVHNLRTRYKT